MSNLRLFSGEAARGYARATLAGPGTPGESIESVTGCGVWSVATDAATLVAERDGVTRQAATAPVFARALNEALAPGGLVVGVSRERLSKILDLMGDGSTVRLRVAPDGRSLHLCGLDWVALLMGVSGSGT